jgi:hypothetical protein
VEYPSRVAPRVAPANVSRVLMAPKRITRPAGVISTHETLTEVARMEGNMATTQSISQLYSPQTFLCKTSADLDRSMAQDLRALKAAEARMDRQERKLQLVKKAVQR